MIIANFVLANSVNRRSCLCIQHQNVALKLKMLKKDHIKHIPSYPDIFIKTYRDQEEIRKLFETCKTKSYRLEQWKKTLVTFKSRSGEEKVIKKMKTVNKKRSNAHSEKEFVEEIAKFIEHSTRIKEQFKAQRTLKVARGTSWPCLYSYGFCGRLPMPLSGGDSISILVTNASYSAPGCGLLQERQ